MIHFFSSSYDLKEYVKIHNEITWHCCVGIGSLLFIDSDNLGIHVVFDSRKDYENWKRDGEPVQICLF